jgi:hypothetical protein
MLFADQRPSHTRHTRKRPIIANLGQGVGGALTNFAQGRGGAIHEFNAPLDLGSSRLHGLDGTGLDALIVAVGKVDNFVDGLSVSGLCLGHLGQYHSGACCVASLDGGEELASGLFEELAAGRLCLLEQRLLELFRQGLRASKHRALAELLRRLCETLVQFRALFGRGLDDHLMDDRICLDDVGGGGAEYPPPDSSRTTSWEIGSLTRRRSRTK